MQRKLAILALLASLYGATAIAETVQVTQINAREFRAAGAGSHVFTPNNLLRMFCFPDSNNSYAVSQVRLPDGAQLQNMRVYATDAGAQNLQVSLLKECQPSFDGGPISAINLLSLTTSGTPGDTTLSGAIPLQPTVDNEQCIYVVQARFGDAGNACDPNVQLQRVRLQWSN